MGLKIGLWPSFVLWVFFGGGGIADIKMPTQYDYNGVLQRPGKERMLYKLKS